MGIVNDTVIVTGTAGLVGSACVRRFCAERLHVVGVDNDMRGRFFGPEASTLPSLTALCNAYPDEFTFVHGDVRDAELADRLCKIYGSDLCAVVHAAAQPSHDFAAVAPFEDFTINAQGTLNWLEMVRRHAPGAVFILVSTNKVYGDLINRVGNFVEGDFRYHSLAFSKGVDETFSIDQSMHSLFGASKLYGDIAAQEYGRYFGMRTVVFRCGCVTGSAHAGVETHGFLSYLVKCAVTGKPYTVYGYKGKQVRDQIHAEDLASAFLQVIRNSPDPGTVFNLGGGLRCNCSVLEALEMCSQHLGRVCQPAGFGPARAGDHVWWVSNTGRFCGAYPEWRPKWTLLGMVEDIAGACTASR